MIVNKSLLIAALAVLAAGASAQAADSKPASKPAAAPAQAQPAAGKPTPEQIADIERAAHIWQAFNVVMESKDATVPVKNALLACLYNNKLSTISVAAGKVFAANPNMKEDNIDDVFHAAGGVCGLGFKKPEGTAGAAPAIAPKAPAPAPKTSSGH
ncbi:MAG TPA: hypothetical protein VF418_02285 [Sphingomonadaceae bacterium]